MTELTKSDIEELLIRADGYWGGYNFEQTKALIQGLAKALREARND